MSRFAGHTPGPEIDEVLAKHRPSDYQRRVGRMAMEALQSGVESVRHAASAVPIHFDGECGAFCLDRDLLRQRDELGKALRFLVSDAEIATGAMAPERGTELRESCRIARAALAKLEADS